MTVRPPSLTPAEADAIAAEFLLAHTRAERRRRRIGVMLNILGVLIFFGLWELLPRIGTVLNPVLFPPPSKVLATAFPMILSGEIPYNILVSLGRAGTGFAIAACLGVMVGVATARIVVVRELIEPLLHGLRSLPVIALVPVSVLWFGIGEGAKVALVATGAFFPIWINTFIGVRDVHQVYLRSAACLGANRLQTLRFIILPASLPFIIAGMRQGIAVALIVLVAAELAGARAGVAYMMSMGHQLFRVDIMFAGLILLGALGYTCDRLFVALCRRIFPWYRPSA
ncbi:ABC transporter permease [Acuticoccus kandeliae]|uniref:ABC transporter permease n=1 Tax=Acuticoccus kandeliae TaxID=2073160 RepID=UPI00196ADAF5|nr:ABC transporter permease [Acuticoccus kandeliae]